MENLIIVGIGPSADFYYEFVKTHSLFNIIGFAVNRRYRTSQEMSYKGLPVYTLENIVEETGHSDFRIFVALMWNRLNADRRKVFEFCDSLGLEFASLVSPVSVNHNATIGRNCFIGDYSVLYAGAVLEDDCILPGNAMIGEFSKVGKHSFIAFQSVLGGYVEIGEQSFVGMHATIFDQTRIGRKCIVGAGVCVRRNISDYTVISIDDAPLKIKVFDEFSIEEKLRADKKIR